MSYPFWLIFLSEEIRYESFPPRFYFIHKFMDQTQDSCYIIFSLGLWYRNKWNQIYSVRKDVYMKCSLGPFPFSLSEKKGECRCDESISQIFHVYNRTCIMMSWRYLKCETVNRNISDLDIFIESAYWMGYIFSFGFQYYVYRDVFELNDSI